MPPWRAVAAGALGLLVLAGVGSGLAPDASEGSGDVERASVLGAKPVPAFLASVGAEGVAARVGLVRTEPPRVLAVPEAGSVSPSRGAGGEVAPNRAGASVSTATGARKPGAVGLTGTPIKIFFARHPDSDAAFTAVYPIARVAPDRGVAAAALAKLIEGPTTDERAAGYFSELGRSLTGSSSCGGRDFNVAIRDGVATVRFCRTVTSAGIGQDARVRAQIEATLKQFSTVRSVKLLGADGHCLFDQSGLDRCRSEGSTEPPASPPSPRV